MAIRLSGINSGLDTDALVKELVSAYSLKTQKYEKQQTKLEWKKEAWQGLNTKIYGLYTNISNLRYDTAYNLKKTSVSDSTKATVTASSEAVSGTQKLQITQTAQAAYITGSRLDDDITKGSTLKDLGYAGDDTEIKVTKANGDEVKIAINGDTKISDLVTKFQEAGLNASFDENNGRFFISAKESGKANDFDIIADTDAGKNVLSALGLSSVDEQKAAIQRQVTEYDALLQRLSDLNYSGDDDANGVYQNAADDYYNAESRYLARVALSKIEGVANDSFDTSEFLEKIAESKEAGNDDAINSYLKDCGVEDATDIKEQIQVLKLYDSANGNLTDSVDTIKAAMEQAKEDNATALEIMDIKSKIAIYSDTVKDVASGKTTIDKAVDSKNAISKIDGQDAEIVLNGATFTSTSNSFSINGLTIEVHAETQEDEELSISTAVDNQGIYDKIKDFLTEYNSVINEITKLYNADSAKGYEPLTDEEKDAMSETQIEKWEDKIKDSLLRRDTSLGNVMNAMINSMSQTFEVDGQKLSLSNFGISTLGFLNAAENEQYAYHIDGDEDDSNTSGKTDKLMTAIQTNPDQIIDFMKQLSENLYKSIDEKMKSTELSSVYKVYNDKEMDNELKEIEELIEKWEDKVAAEEDYYYNKFSDMEVALSKLQSQTSALSGLLGQ